MPPSEPFFPYRGVVLKARPARLGDRPTPSGWYGSPPFELRLSLRLRDQIFDVGRRKDDRRRDDYGTSVCIENRCSLQAIP